MHWGGVEVHLLLISLKEKVNFSVSDTGLTGKGQKMFVGVRITG
jgi:hypothetical protein